MVVVVIVVEEEDGTTASAKPLTPDDGRFRFADGVLRPTKNNDNDNDGDGLLYCVREDHAKPDPKHVVNEIVAVQLPPSATPDTTTKDKDETAMATMTVVATGNDFYAAPRVSPDGTQLAYITWNHPNMPWDATELRVVPLLLPEDPDHQASAEKTNQHTLVAGADGDTSILQPQWHPLTGDLYYLSDESGYYNLYRAG